MHSTCLVLPLHYGTINYWSGSAFSGFWKINFARFILPIYWLIFRNVIKFLSLTSALLFNKFLHFFDQCFAGEWAEAGGQEKERFLLHDNGPATDSRMIIFATDRTLSLLADSVDWYMV